MYIPIVCLLQISVCHIGIHFIFTPPFIRVKTFFFVDHTLDRFRRDLRAPDIVGYRYSLLGTFKDLRARLRRRYKCGSDDDKD